MAGTIDKALKKKEELERELRRINDFIEMYEQLSGTDREHSDLPHQGEKQKTPRVKSPRGTRPGQLVRVMEAILKDVQRPLQRGQLVAELEKRGHALPTTGDKAQYLATILWRNRDCFENLEGRGYWLKGLPVPPYNVTEAERYQHKGGEPY
jgi:hypothetical protein